MNQEENKEIILSVDKIIGHLHLAKFPNARHLAVAHLHPNRLKVLREQLTLSNPAMFLFSAKNSAGDSAGETPENIQNA